MDKKDLTATNFLKSKELREKYQCGICYEVCIKPVRCKGQCSKIFCMKCVSDTRQQHDICPYKCSSPFLVQRIPDIQLEFYCPYNPTCCNYTIASVKDFDEHYRICQFVSQEERYLKQMQLQYKCLKGHQLEFYTGTYEEMLQSECTCCRQTRLSRSFCRICDQIYCVVCRVPPCAKDGCPIGHTYTFQRIANLNFICDMCGVSTAVSNDGVYDDSVCNFGICEGCYLELPDKFDQSKPRELIANVNSICSCGTPLTYVNTIHQASQCTLCCKQKQCPKVCKNCERKYCLSCKLMDINGDGTCGFDHQLQACSILSGTQEFIHKETQFGCMKCGRSEQEYYYDRKCKTRICGACYSYCQTVTVDKQRPIIVKCQKNHVLMYVTGPEDHYDVCSACQKQKIIKLRCMHCSDSQYGLGFCFQCRPVLLETCYYKHKLKLTKFQSSRQCHFCRVQTKEFHYCKKCYFYACKKCVETSLHEKQMVAEDLSKEGQEEKMEVQQVEVQ